MDQREFDDLKARVEALERRMGNMPGTIPAGGGVEHTSSITPRQAADNASKREAPKEGMHTVDEAKRASQGPPHGPVARPQPESGRNIPEPAKTTPVSKK